jgi:rhodanese-related sulfurtransferase
LCLKASSILSNKFIQFLISLILVTFLAAAPVAAQAQVALLFGDLTWLRINTYLDKEYPDVVSLSTKELAAQSGVTLLDTRTVEEFNASHLPGAKHYDSAKAFVGSLTKNTPIVVYCSVGVRSAAIARKLQADGYTDVKNLRGSSFMWANEGRALDGPAAPQVHPFNARWGALLNPNVRLKL